MPAIKDGRLQVISSSGWNASSYLLATGEHADPCRLGKLRGANYSFLRLHSQWRANNHRLCPLPEPVSAKVSSNDSPWAVIPDTTSLPSPQSAFPHFPGAALTMMTASVSETPVSMNRALIDLPDEIGQRARTTLFRAFRRRCPYCGGKHVLQSTFAIKKRCPTCGVLFAYEDGCFLGSYAVNLVTTEFIAVAIVIWMLVNTDLSVLQMQTIAVIFAVGLPLGFYSYALLLWMALDLTINPPRDFSERPRI